MAAHDAFRASGCWARLTCFCPRNLRPAERRCLCRAGCGSVIARVRWVETGESYPIVVL